MDNIWSTEQQPKFQYKFTPLSYQEWPKSFDKLQIKWLQWLTTRKPKFVDQKANDLFIIASLWTFARL
jgi:hypothetical protein